jgi:hypothetical protein
MNESGCREGKRAYILETAHFYRTPVTMPLRPDNALFGVARLQEFGTLMGRHFIDKLRGIYA